MNSVFAVDPDYYDEPYRNQFHFSPEANWMNDPNGMVYYEGEYHLFYQYHPYGTTWGPMHWGHAVSKDLVHWEHLPIALYPDENGQIFSGSAVIDWNNTAGFGKEAMVAIFTHSGEKGQVQSIAYSLDKGRTWEKYEGNPVMPNPPIPDWRDPKVFWHDDTNQWIMSLAAKDRIMFYTSPDLKTWEFASEFGPDGGIQANSLDRVSYAISQQSGGSFTYEADITLNEKNGREGAGGLVFRSDQEAKNGYVVELDAKNDEIKLSKNVNGERQEISRKFFSLNTSTTYHIKVEASDHQIKVYVQNELVIEKTDTSFDYGQFGLVAEKSTASFRNVEFKKTTNFLTNLSNWEVVNGKWQDTLNGKVGLADGDAFTMSSQYGANFHYEADLLVSGESGGKGAGALVFRADEQAKNGYFANVDVLNDTVKLMKINNGQISVLAQKETDLTPNQIYHVKISTLDDNIKVYLDDQLIHDVHDGSFKEGFQGLNIWNSSTTFQNVQYSKNIITTEKEIKNHDFETGDLTGWKIIEGNAFTDDHVTETISFWGGEFEHQGNYHLWGFSDLHDGDNATGELQSSLFKLSGSGEINFLLGGGNDQNNRYVSLVRASDGQELIRQANTKFRDEKYNRYVWDASEYIGEILYLKVVDRATGGWGHINIDDVHVYNEGEMPEQVDQIGKEPQKPDPDKLNGTLTDWTAITGDWIPSTHGNNGGIWECPTLIELPIDGDPSKTKWVLQVSMNDGAPAGGSGMQYFVGEFDGKTFTNENSSDQTLWTDYGADFYAAVDWSGIEGENGEKYWLGWMSNWQYANNTPTSTWRSSMTLPRKIELTQTKDGVRLKQTPVSLHAIRNHREKVSHENKTISSDHNLLSIFSGDTYEIIAEFDVSNSTSSEFGLEVRKGLEGETTKIGYDVKKQEMFLDRTHSDTFHYGNEVLDYHNGPLRLDDQTVKMHIIVDRSSIEVFGNNGEMVITDQIFPNPSSQNIKVYSKDGNVLLKSLEIYPLKSSWKKKSGFKTNITEWTTVSGRWPDTMNGKQGQSNGDAFIISNKKAKDFIYQAEINVLDTDSHPNDPDKDTIENVIGAGALVFRSDEKAKNLYAVNVDVKNNVVKLIKFVNGVAHDLATYNKNGSLKLQANTAYDLKVVANGEKIKVYLNGELVIEQEDASYKEGYFGLNVWDSTSLFNHVKAKVK